MTSPTHTSPNPFGTTSSDESVAIVEEFLGALDRLDTARAIELAHADIVYTNVGLPAVRGRQQFTKAMGMMSRFTGFQAINHNIAGNGPIVLTERTDILEFGRFRLEIWVCGTFEVRDGQIIVWRDYFDVANVTKAAVKGLVRMLVSR